MFEQTGNKSKAVANSLKQNGNDGKLGFEFVDNRPKSSVQLITKARDKVNSADQVLQRIIVNPQTHKPFANFEDLITHMGFKLDIFQNLIAQDLIKMKIPNAEINTALKSVMATIEIAFKSSDLQFDSFLDEESGEPLSPNDILNLFGYHSDNFNCALPPPIGSAKKSYTWKEGKEAIEKDKLRDSLATKSATRSEASKDDSGIRDQAKKDISGHTWELDASGSAVKHKSDFEVPAGQAFEEFCKQWFVNGLKQRNIIKTRNESGEQHYNIGDDSANLAIKIKNGKVIVYHMGPGKM